jgi:hypothetical protein
VLIGECSEPIHQWSVLNAQLSVLTGQFHHEVIPFCMNNCEFISSERIGINENEAECQRSSMLVLIDRMIDSDMDIDTETEVEIDSHIHMEGKFENEQKQVLFGIEPEFDDKAFMFDSLFFWFYSYSYSTSFQP